MVATLAAAAQARKADGARLARPDVAVAAPHRHVGELHVPPARRGVAQGQRRARRRIDLVAGVGLEELDVLNKTQTFPAPPRGRWVESSPPAPICGTARRRAPVSPPR